MIGLLRQERGASESERWHALGVGRLRYATASVAEALAKARPQRH